MFSDTTKLYTDTTPIDRDYAAAAVKELYCYCNTSSLLPHYKDKKSPSRDPEIIFVDGPDELKRAIGHLYRKIACGFIPESEGEFFHPESFNDVAHFVDKRGMGPKEEMHSALTEVFYFDIPEFLNKGLVKRWDNPMMLAIDHLYHDGQEERRYHNPWEEIATKVWNHVYLIVTFINKCFIVNRPLEVYTNDKGFHRVDGPALSFRDGSEIYCYQGQLVDKKYILEPETLTLQDVHQHNSRKHYLIDLIGVDHYLEMVKEWQPPQTKGKWSEFFGFSKMVLPTDDLPDEKDERGFTKYRERGYGSSYKDRPYEVDIYLGKVNGEFGLIFSARDGHEVYHFPYGVHPFDTEHGQEIFNKEDRELFDLFDFKEMFSRSMAATFTLSYMNRKFRLKSSSGYGETHPCCRHDIAPSWFKAKMFRQEEALYESPDGEFAVKWEPGEDEEGYSRGQLSLAGEFPGGKEPRGSLFGGCENLPSYNFHVDLEADSWEELLEKWAQLAFEWLALHEDSSRMP